MKRNGCIENNGSAVSPMEWLACVLYARVVTHAKPRWLHTREHAAAAAAAAAAEWKFVSIGVTTGSIASCSSKHLHTYRNHRGRCTRRLSVTLTSLQQSSAAPSHTQKLGLHQLTLQVCVCAQIDEHAYDFSSIEACLACDHCTQSS